MMERATALGKLRKLIGKEFGYRIDSRTASKEEKEAASAALPAANKERDRLKDALNARCDALLKADPEYQQLKAASKEARERSQKLSSTVMHHKFTVGKSTGLFFLVMAQGDTWEEIFAELAKKKATV